MVARRRSARNNVAASVFECSQAVVKSCIRRGWKGSFSIDRLKPRGGERHIVGDGLHYIREMAAGRLRVHAIAAFPTCTFVCKLARVHRRRKRTTYTRGRCVAFQTARLLLLNPQPWRVEPRAADPDRCRPVPRLTLGYLGHRPTWPAASAALVVRSHRSVPLLHRRRHRPSSLPLPAPWGYADASAPHVDGGS